jgi:hypothetical protein
MSTSARAQVITSIETDDPEVVARQRHLVQLLVAQHPEFEHDLQQRGRKEGQLVEARASLRRVLARRGLQPTAEEEVRIDACKTLATIRRWLDEAVVASSVAEALGLPRRA